jgi:hypothetical protein
MPHDKNQPRDASDIANSSFVASLVAKASAKQEEKRGTIAAPHLRKIAKKQMLFSDLLDILLSTERTDKL